MAKNGLLLSFFREPEDAQPALRALGRKGFRRRVLLERTADGRVLRRDPRYRERNLIHILLGLSLGGLSWTLGYFGMLPQLLSSPTLNTLLFIGLGLILGTGLGGLLSKRVLPSVSKRLADQYARWLRREESLLILLAPVHSLAGAVRNLRDSIETEASIFALHPQRDFPPLDASQELTTLTMPQIEEHAARLAQEHQVDFKGKSNRLLLDHLKNARRTIHDVCSDLGDSIHLEQNLSPVAEWILDNEYLIESHGRDILTNLPKRYYRELPKLREDPDRDYPRVYSLAKDLIAHTDARLDRQKLVAFLDAYQEVECLTIGELWALPLMLRVALIQQVDLLARQAWQEQQDRELADLWANRLLAILRRDPDQLFAVLADLAEQHSQPSPYFAVQLSGHLYDEDAALVPVQSWLERSLRKPLTELHTEEQSRQAVSQVSIGNAITSLRQLSLLDWREIFEELSHVEAILQRDPAGIYSQMDFDTRNQYREVVEVMAKGAGLEEVEVARQVVERASQAEAEEGWESRHKHIGTYLIGEGRAAFSKSIHCREKAPFRIRRWIYQHHTPVYLGLILATTLVVMAYPLIRIFNSGLNVLNGLVLGFLTLPASQLATEAVNYLVTRILPARNLPKMDFSQEGIPDAFRTLVVIPMLLTDPETIEDEVQKLEIRYLGNREYNLVFGLFSDFLDADSEEKPRDQALLEIARDGIQRLNQTYGQGRFYLFHRQRVWCETEGKFIGWERKRGKLEELNCLILGQRGEDQPSIVAVGDEDRLRDIRFVITLDSDTQLPRDTARRMIETLAHPLNQPRIDHGGRIAEGSYTIIQPRVSPSLPSATATRFSRIYTDPVGTDPYTKAVSNVYQDLSGEGSYIGKGIYDPRAFHRILEDTFPEERLLSHDLIEGVHVRTGLATDIELFDEFPSDYRGYSSRQHRWIRGDWQIAEWILPRVPSKDQERIPNPLGALSRWKIFDNLRRSLVPGASVAALIFTWLVTAELPVFTSLLVGAGLLFQPLAGPLTWATSSQGLRSLSLRQIAHDLARAFSEASLLMHQAGLALDAILRVFYRRWISQRKLLEWTTAQMAERKSGDQENIFQLNFWLISGLSAVLTTGVYLLNPGRLPAALPWLILWFFSPLVAGLLTRKQPVLSQQGALRDKDNRKLYRVARRTWRYFDDFVGPDTNWLPPDNYQVSHQNQLALRTSPTNIGMWMLSALAASDFGYLTLDDAVHRLEKTLAALGDLERHRGHLLNWYNLEDLQPLSPRYLSSVDSGNFIAALWTLEQGIEEKLAQPTLDSSILTGLRDTGEVLLEELNHEQASGEVVQGVARLLEKIEDCSPAPLAIIQLIRDVQDQAQDLADRARDFAGTQARAAYWARKFERQLTGWSEFIDRYLLWMPMLAERSEKEIAETGLEGLLTLYNNLSDVPSLRDLAGGNLADLRDFDPGRTDPACLNEEDPGWLEVFCEVFSRSRWFAGEMVSQAERLADDMRVFSDQIDLGFLYDEDRSLFTIGYNLDVDQFDGSYYDLLASESRLGSYVAIARGDVPVDHWLSLNRPYGSHRGHRVLLSWTGTMFEYLMPLLLQRSYPNSLLDQAAREAVDLQIAYGKKRRIPWGISESAYGDLDLNKTYQYKAFGVPWLGLKRDLEEDLVVAPYAALLAVGIDPGAVVKNINRLENKGMLNDYGYFEAVDYNRRPRSDAEPGVIVRAYMAHHQGMGFLALGNFLHDDLMKNRFHQDPRVKAAEPLLYERVPVSPPVHHISTREEISTRVQVLGIAPSISKFDTPHTNTPKVQLLSNGQLSSMATNAGGGYLHWKEMAVTRWRADSTRDHYGSFLYLRDTDSGETWSNLYHPLDKTPEYYTVHFPLDRAEYRRRDNGIETRTEVIVSPEDDVEIRRITLINRSIRARRVQATSYYELAMSAPGADRQHPAFNKLFIQTESLAERQALLAYRRPRHKDDPPIYTIHSLNPVGQTLPVGMPQFETDRRVFIGRGHSLANPLGVETKLGLNEGYVLDPVFSMRREIHLAPGQSVELIALLGVADSREGALHLLEKYRDSAVIERAFEISWASTQLNLRSLRIHPDEARRFQKLAGFLLYPTAYLRPPTDRLDDNRQGQAGLWKHGISGDLPILLVTIADVGDLGLVRQLLQAQAYWKQHGLLIDLVILNEESSSYEQPLMERLEKLVQSSTIYTGEDQVGGVFLRAVDQIEEEDLLLLQAVARVSLVAARGPLAQQIGVPHETIEEPEQLDAKRVDEEPSRPLPFLELPYFNSLGGFSPDGKEYVIYLGAETNTPAPWINVIANPHFGTLLSENGAGFTWYGNSQRNRLTDWSNDPVLDPHSEVIYIRDEDSGKVWNPTAGPIRERNAYRVSHGAGYSRYEHNSHAIEQLLTVFVPTDEEGGEPLKISKLRLRNDSKKTRRLTVTYYVEWTLGEQREMTQQHVVTEWESRPGLILARNGYHPEYGERVAFAAISPAADSFTCDRTVFLGRNRGAKDPAALKRVGLSERVGAALDPCGALQTKLELPPGETMDVICVLGQGDSEEQAKSLARKYREVLSVNQALDETKDYWDRILDTVQVETPELSVNFLLNRWLLYQSLSCRIWGRSAFYQSGGAFGYRDQLQDVAAFLFTEPALAREQILLAASRQFTEGDVQHWWHPPSGGGIRSRISDDLLWLPYITAQYVRVTGDSEILQEQIPFLNAPELEPDEHEVFLEPQVTKDQATLFEHCRRAVEKGLTRGPQGLPLIGTGDWNDGMNRVGEEGRGESVWLGWFLTQVLKDMAWLSGVLGEEELAADYQGEREALETRIEKAAWDGSWYIRGTFDDGSPLGSADNLEARIDSLPQSWPWISEAGDPERKEQAIESAWRQLVRKEEGLVLLFTPPFDVSQPSPGYIKGYPPGVRENGGQYTHAALWLAKAFARKGDGNRAGEILRILNPVEHARGDIEVWRYTVEPYVIAADVYRLPGRIGHGGWSWYTGSAAWMYRVWTEDVLGLKKRGDRLILDPVIPDWWDGYQVQLRHGEAIYEIEVLNPDHQQSGIAWMELDGRPIEEDFIDLDPEPVKHTLRLQLGQRE